MVYFCFTHINPLIRHPLARNIPWLPPRFFHQIRCRSRWDFKAVGRPTGTYCWKGRISEWLEKTWAMTSLRQLHHQKLLIISSDPHPGQFFLDPVSLIWSGNISGGLSGIRHLFWHPVWHLSYVLTFYLAFFLALCLAFSLAFGSRCHTLHRWRMKHVAPLLKSRPSPGRWGEITSSIPHLVPWHSRNPYYTKMYIYIYTYIYIYYI